MQIGTKKNQSPLQRLFRIDLDVMLAAATLVFFSYVLRFILHITGIVNADPNLSEGAKVAAGGDKFNQLLLIVLAGFAVARLIMRRVNVLHIAFTAWPLTLLLLYTCLSPMWSDVPDVTLRRCAGLALTAMIAVYIGTTFSLDRLLGIIAVVFLPLLLASGIVANLMPEIGRSTVLDHNNSWTGVFPHRAHLAMISAFAALAWHYMAMKRRRWRRVFAALAALFCVYVLIMSGSKTALLAWLVAVTALVPIGVLRSFRMFGTQLSPTLARGIIAFMGLIGLAFFVGILPFIPELIGRDLTFSGRTRFWHYALQTAGEGNLMLGTGYRSFWEFTSVYLDILNSKAYLTDSDRLLSSTLANGHNGFIDVVCELGLIGLVFFVGFLIWFYGLLIRRLPQDSGLALSFIVSLLMWVFIQNLTITLYLAHSELTWFLMMTVSCYLVKDTTAAKQTHSLAQSVKRQLQVTS